MVPLEYHHLPFWEWISKSIIPTLLGCTKAYHTSVVFASSYRPLDQYTYDLALSGGLCGLEDDVSG